MVPLENHPELSVAQPPTTSDMGIIKAKIDEARKAELVKIYTAGSDDEFEKEYEAYMELLNKIGVQELNEYMTQTVAEVKEQYGF